MHVEIRDPDDKIILSKVFYRNKKFWDFEVTILRCTTVHCTAAKENSHLLPTPLASTHHLFVQVIMILLACYNYNFNSHFPLSVILSSGSLALSWGSIWTSRWLFTKDHFCLGLIKIASDTCSSKVGEHAINYANAAQKVGDWRTKMKQPC